MKRFGLAGVIALAACAARPAEPTAPSRGHMGDGSDPVASQSDMVCKDETPTGTALERRKCRSAAEMEQDRQLVRTQMEYGSSRMGCPDAGCVTGPQIPNPNTPGSRLVPGFHGTPR